MEPRSAVGARSVGSQPELSENRFGSNPFPEESRRFMSLRHDTGSSFSALLELPATQAIELLHLTDPNDSLALVVAGAGNLKPPFTGPVVFPPGAGAVMEYDSRFSVFAGQRKVNDSPVKSSVPSNPNAENEEVKDGAMKMDSPQQLVLDPRLENQNQNPKSIKRKEQETKNNQSSKKRKSSAHAKNSEDADKEKLPYVHVRVGRGQATDSHSLAERARREKINARMKLLQDLVPGCNKISGTAVMLDEIINHVQFLQRQVEFLSMRLAAVNPRIDINLDDILAAELWRHWR